MRKQNLVECENYFKQWIGENGYDYKKVQIMTALIFLNIAALHHYPYSLLLFYLGKNMLSEILDKNLYDNQKVINEKESVSSSVKNPAVKTI